MRGVEVWGTSELLGIGKEVPTRLYVSIENIGRGERIRTSGLLVPNQRGLAMMKSEQYCYRSLRVATSAYFSMIYIGFLQRR